MKILVTFFVHGIVAFFFLAVYYEYNYSLFSLLKVRAEQFSEEPVPYVEHPQWLSVQPEPHPYALPKFFRHAMGPLVSPILGADYNYFTYVFIKPGAGVELVGKLNRTLYSNFSFYNYRHWGENATEDSPSIESASLKLEENSRYRICLGPTKTCDNWIDTGESTHGFLLIRNYQFTDNTEMHYPAVYWGKELKIPEQRHIAHSVLPTL